MFAYVLLLLQGRIFNRNINHMLEFLKVLYRVVLTDVLPFFVHYFGNTICAYGDKIIVQMHISTHSKMTINLRKTECIRGSIKVSVFHLPIAFSIMLTFHVPLLYRKIRVYMGILFFLFLL